MKDIESGTIQSFLRMSMPYFLIWFVVGFKPPIFFDCLGSFIHCDIIRSIITQNHTKKLHKGFLWYSLEYCTACITRTKTFSRKMLRSTLYVNICICASSPASSLKYKRGVLMICDARYNLMGNTIRYES